MWFSSRRTSQSRHGVGFDSWSGLTPATMCPVASRARWYWFESNGSASADGGGLAFLAAGRLRLGHLVDPPEPLDQPVAGLLGRGRQPLDGLQLPLLHDHG